MNNIKNMKKKVIVGLLIAGLVGASSVSFAQDATDGSGYFLQGQVGVSNAHVDSNKTTAAVLGGYRWDVGNGWSVGPELGLEHVGRYTYNTGFGSVTQKLNDVKVGADTQYQINDRWYVGTHAGYARTYLNTQLHGLAYEHSDNLNGWYTGAKVGYNLDRNISLFTNVDYNRANSGGSHASYNTYTVGVQYAFGG